MRRIYFVLLILVAALSANANPIDRQQARQQAEKFLQAKGATLSGEAARAIGRTSSSQQPLYVFNAADNRGFVIVAGDDRIEPIIGYTTQGSFEEGDLPDNFRAWLEQTAAEIEAIKNSPAQTSDMPASIAAAKKVSIHTAINPLIITTWNQGNSSSNDLNTDGVYNVHLPMINGKYPCTGCVATAGAQIMYYYHRDLPNMTQPVPGYKLTDKDGNDVSKGADTSADLPAIQFQWDMMKTKYSKDDPDADAVSAVADLMLYCGYAAHMNYGVDASSASTPTLAKGMSDYFDFNPNTWRSIYRRYYSISEWDEIVYNELACGRPIIYSGSYSGAHAFICDGYDGAGMYHFNWGWGGHYNGYYKLQATNPYGDLNTTKMGYIDENHCIIGLQPNSWPHIYYTDTDDTWESVAAEGIIPSIYSYEIDNTTLTIRLHNTTGEDQYWGYALGEVNNDNTITIIDAGYESHEDRVLKANYIRGITFNVGSYSLSEGVHNLIPLNKLKGETEWKRCTPTDTYFEVRVSGGTCSIIAHPVENLKINQFDLASGGTPGKYQAINLSITNNGDNIEERLYIYLGTADDNGKSATSKVIKIASGNTKDYNIYIGKLDAGDYVLRLLNPQKEVLAEKAISIALDLKATKIEVADPKITSYDIKVVATVENRAGDYAVPLYLFASNGGGTKTFKYAVGSAIERGSSEDVTFYFKADKAGTWTLYITSDKDGNNVIGETTIEVAEAPTGTVELKLEGSSVKCSGNSVTYTMSIKNTGSTTNYQEIRTWLYQGEAFVASNYSPKVIIEPGETKSVSVSYEGLETGTDYNISINYSIQPVSWKGKWLGSYAFTFNPSEGGTTPGDANGDNKVDATDIVDIVNYMMGKATSTGTFNKVAADLNNDNVVNAADIVLLINMLVNSR